VCIRIRVLARGLGANCRLAVGVPSVRDWKILAVFEESSPVRQSLATVIFVTSTVAVCMIVICE
jgi:hypothetical protein